MCDLHIWFDGCVGGEIVSTSSYVQAHQNEVEGLWWMVDGGWGVMGVMGDGQCSDVSTSSYIDMHQVFLSG